jgi:DNA-binding transcriptional regulator YhcF (GntR family)
MGRQPSSRNTALEYLRGVLAAAPTAAQALVGTLPELSAQAGVSRATMARVVRVLKDEGVLRTVAGKGIYSAGTGPSVPRAPVSPLRGPPEQKWHLAAGALRREIIAGGHAVNQVLPVLKVLADRYHVDVRTLRKALHLLHHEGYLTLSGGRFAVAGPQPGRRGSRIVMVTRAIPRLDRPFGSWSQRSRRLLESLEGDCRSRGVTLDYVFSHYEQESLLFTPSVNEAVMGKGTEALGVILHMETRSAELVNAVVRQLVPVNAPIAVVDEHGLFGTRVPVLPTMRIVRLGVGSQCGKDMGQYLIRLGHRRVRYLDYDPMDEWSRLRFDGLREAFVEAGIRDGVGLSLLGPHTPSRFSLATYDPVALAPHGLPRRLHEEAERALRRVEHIVWESVREEMRQPVLRRKLAQALRIPGVTAWVASGDSLAISCLNVLRQQGVAVPRQLSIVGFDDTPDALYHGLTSYSFNPTGIARTLVDTALTPVRSLRRSGGPVYVDVPGYVSERRTVASPPSDC